MDIPTNATPFHVPDHLGYVTGIRTWRVAHPGYLMDINDRTVYSPLEKQIASCLKGPWDKHIAPNADCDCGFWIIKPNALHNYEGWLNARSYLGSFQTMWGTCYGWGKVIEHKFGWRVEFAYPGEIYYSLTTSTTYIQTLLETSKRYMVPLSLKDFSQTYPQLKLKITLF